MNLNITGNKLLRYYSNMQSDNDHSVSRSK